MKRRAPKPLVVPLREAAELLSVSTRTLERMHAAGTLVILKIGRLRMVPISEIERMTSMPKLDHSAPPTTTRVVGSVVGAD